MYTYGSRVVQICLFWSCRKRFCNVCGKHTFIPKTFNCSAPSKTDLQLFQVKACTLSLAVTNKAMQYSAHNLGFITAMRVKLTPLNHAIILRKLQQPKETLTATLYMFIATLSEWPYIYTKKYRKT